MRRNVMEESVTGEISDNSLLISPDLRVPLSELQYRTSRSGGPGGQHVNTSSTRVEITWNVSNSPSLSPEQRTRLLQQLATRLDTEGQLRLVSSGTGRLLQARMTRRKADWQRAVLTGWRCRRFRGITFAVHS